MAETYFDDSKVEISLEEFKTLIRRSEQFGVLLDMLYEDASLCYNEKELSFDRDNINIFLRCICTII